MAEQEQPPPTNTSSRGKLIPKLAYRRHCPREDLPVLRRCCRCPTQWQNFASQWVPIVNSSATVAVNSCTECGVSTPAQEPFSFHDARAECFPAETFLCFTQSATQVLDPTTTLARLPRTKGASSSSESNTVAWDSNSGQHPMVVYPFRIVVPSTHRHG